MRIKEVTVIQQIPYSHRPITLERFASMMAIISPMCSKKNSSRATSPHDLSSVMHTLSATALRASGG